MENSIFIGRKIADETRFWLEQNKISFEEHPLIQIEYNQPAFITNFDNQSQFSQFVITSQHAAIWLAKHHAEIGFTENDVICCISEKQREICKNVTKNCFVADQQNAQSLVDLVLGKNFPAQVVFLCGNQSLNTVESQLQSYKYGFRLVEVYRNLPVLTETQNEFSIYLFFSPGGVRNFYNSDCRIAKSAEIIAIGSTTAATCSALFTNRVTVSAEQNELSVVKCAVDLLMKKEYQTI